MFRKRRADLARDRAVGCGQNTLLVRDGARARAYVEPATNFGPDDNELLYGRAIYFGPYFGG